MSTDQTPIQLRKAASRPPAESDLADAELLQFALGIAGSRKPASAEQLIAEFGDVEVILASAPEDLQQRGGLDDRAVAVLKLLHAFRRDCRGGGLLH